MLQRCTTLQILRIDDGHELQLCDKTIRRIASRNPYLREVTLDKASMLTDSSIIEILKHCDNIKAIKVTGTDYEYGGVVGDFTGYLQSQAHEDGKAGALCALHLDDQRLKEEFIRGVSKKRPNLRISNGKTVNALLARGLNAHMGSMWLTIWMGGQTHGGNGMVEVRQEEARLDRLEQLREKRKELARQNAAGIRAEGVMKRRLSDAGPSSLPLAKSARVPSPAVESGEDDVENGDEGSEEG
jgi:hypothetical protein